MSIAALTPIRRRSRASPRLRAPGAWLRREAVFVDRDAAFSANSAKPPAPESDRIVVIGGSGHTLDLLRLATVRSDDVMLISEAVDDATRRFIDHFAIEYRAGRETEADLAGAAAILVSVGEVDRENFIVRHARRRRIPVHVENRPLVSDFTMLALVERRPETFAR